MPKTDDHKLHRDWRRPRAEALRTDALAIRETIEHLDDLVDLFEYEQKNETASDLRSVIGTLKTHASDAEDEAERLTAVVQTRELEEIESA